MDGLFAWQTFIELLGHGVLVEAKRQEPIAIAVGERKVGFHGPACHAGCWPDGVLTECGGLGTGGDARAQMPAAAVLAVRTAVMELAHAIARRRGREGRQQER